MDLAAFAAMGTAGKHSHRLPHLRQAQTGLSHLRQLLQLQHLLEPPEHLAPSWQPYFEQRTAAASQVRPGALRACALHLRSYLGHDPKSAIITTAALGESYCGGSCFSHVWSTAASTTLKHQEYPHEPTNTTITTVRLGRSALVPK